MALVCELSTFSVLSINAKSIRPPKSRGEGERRFKHLIILEWSTAEICIATFICKKCTYQSWPIICPVKCYMIKSLAQLLPHKKQLHSPPSLQSTETEAECTGLSCLLDCTTVFLRSNSHKHILSSICPLGREKSTYYTSSSGWDGKEGHIIREEGHKCTCMQRTFDIVSVLFSSINRNTVPLWRTAQVYIQVLGKLSCWKASLLSDDNGNKLMMDRSFQILVCYHKGGYELWCRKCLNYEHPVALGKWTLLTKTWLTAQL